MTFVIKSKSIRFSRAGTIVLVCAGGCSPDAQNSLYPRIEALFDIAEPRILAVVKRIEDEHGASATAFYPVETGVVSPHIGRWSLRPVEDWRSGFFPGVLWELEGHSGNARLHDAAIAWTEGLAILQDNPIDHDLGFRFVSSFGVGFALQDESHSVWRDHAQDVMAHAALALDQLFDVGNVPVGALRAFPLANDYLAPYPVYIDSMMNIELLFFAWNQAGRPTSGPLGRFYDHAVKHAQTVLDEHLRADGSTYHIVQYAETGPMAGFVYKKISDQGFAAESTWSRGQAWAIHGFTTTHHYTKDTDAILATRFLDAAKRAADYFINHLPHYDLKDPYNHVVGDFVPPTDFDAALGEPAGPWNDANGDDVLGDRRAGTHAFTPRDTSAAAVAAAGLLKLGAIVEDSALRDRYLGAAEDILECLLTFRDADGALAYLALERSGEAILARGATAFGSPQRSLVYGDRYFLEAARLCLELPRRSGEVRRCGK